MDQAERMAAKAMHVRQEMGMPGSRMTIVTWYNASGSEVQKSKFSRKTGVLLPTWSQSPSSVSNLTASPRLVRRGQVWF